MKRMLICYYVIFPLPSDVQNRDKCVKDVLMNYLSFSSASKTKAHPCITCDTIRSKTSLESRQVIYRGKNQVGHGF